MKLSTAVYSLLASALVVRALPQPDTVIRISHTSGTVCTCAARTSTLTRCPGSDRIAVVEEGTTFVRHGDFKGPSTRRSLTPVPNALAHDG